MDRITLSDIRRVKVEESQESFTGYMVKVNDSTDGIPATLIEVFLYRQVIKMRSRIKELEEQKAQ